MRNDEGGPENKMRRETILSRNEGTQIDGKVCPNKELWKIKRIRDTEPRAAKRRELCKAEKK